MSIEANASPAEQCTAGGIIFGLVSCLTCWWFPFGAILGTFGLLLGSIGLARGKEVQRSLVGICLSAIGGFTGLLLAWDYWWRIILGETIWG